jgi:hypothetical protein
LNTAFSSPKLTVLYLALFLFKERSMRVCQIKFRNFNLNVLWILLSTYIAQDHGFAKSCRLSWLTNSALVYEPKCGGSCGVSANEHSCAHGAQINFGDLTPYSTYAQDAPRVDKIGQPRVTCERSAPLVRCYLAGWGLPALAAGITAASTLSPASNLGNAEPPRKWRQ